ncbi:MAG: transcriptional regulator [Verrucomicrobia bacterium]|nr:MAG: transcriptional regulator [Verrucomicrobiota bacterium]
MSKQSYSKKLSSPFSTKSATRTEGVPQDAFLQLVADRFKLLSEPMRLRLIHALIEGEFTVSALVEKVGATQANVSRHLQTLAQAGILGRRKDGLHVYYRIEDESILELCEHVCGGLQRQSEARVRLFD